jgi:hypothetical protein
LTIFARTLSQRGLPRDAIFALVDEPLEPPTSARAPTITADTAIDT